MISPGFTRWKSNLREKSRTIEELYHQSSSNQFLYTRLWILTKDFSSCLTNWWPLSTGPGLTHWRWPGTSILNGASPAQPTPSTGPTCRNIKHRSQLGSLIESDKCPEAGCGDKWRWCHHHHHVGHLASPAHPGARHPECYIRHPSQTRWVKSLH